MIPAARTGRERTRRRAATTILHTNKETFSNVMSDPRIFHMVLMKLILLRIELAPAKCKLKIAKSTALPV